MRTRFWLPVVAAFALICVNASANLADGGLYLARGGLTAYEKCWRVAQADCGRYIAEDGIVTKHGVREATDAELAAWRARLRAIFAPPEPVYVEPAYVAPATAPAPVAAPTTSTGGCVGMEAESGSAGYAAYNPSSGARGCYQVIPSTHDALCSDLGWDPGGQDACAARICESQGSGAWASSGANPCG